MKRSSIKENLKEPVRPSSSKVLSKRNSATSSQKEEVEVQKKKPTPKQVKPIGLKEPRSTRSQRALERENSNRLNQDLQSELMLTNDITQILNQQYWGPKREAAARKIQRWYRRTVSGRAIKALSEAKQLLLYKK